MASHEDDVQMESDGALDLKDKKRWCCIRFSNIFISCFHKFNCCFLNSGARILSLWYFILIKFILIYKKKICNFYPPSLLSLRFGFV